MLFTSKKARELHLCETEKDHLWRPITDILQPADLWRWTCANCGHTVLKSPIPATFITATELDKMIDTSLSIADKVIEDNQSVKGELWLMRSSFWMYWPYKFHICYHVYHGNLFVVFFRYQEGFTATIGKLWSTVADTDSYRKLLETADRKRASCPESINLWLQWKNP